MARRAPRQLVKDAASAGLTPAEALMLQLENIEPGRLELLGAEEEQRIRAKAKPARKSRMDDAAPLGGSPLAKESETCLAAALAWSMPAASDGVGREAPREWAKVFGDAMAGHGFRHHDRVRLDHDVAPADGDIVLAEVQGVGRVLRKLSIIGGVHVLSADAGVKPIVVEDLSQLVYYGVVAEKLAR